MADLKNVTDLDSNVWYHVTEYRVDKSYDQDFGSMLQSINDQLDLRVFGTGDKRDYWQFQKVDDEPGRYSLRFSGTAAGKQLGVCYVEDVQENTNTRACLQDSNGSDEQKWNVGNWGNDTYRLYNVKNGTNYFLDVIPGSALYLNPNTDTKTIQPAQRWLMTSVKDIDDGAYSTVFTNIPKATSAGATTTDASSTASPTGGSSGSSGDSSSDSSDSSSSSLSTGAAAGIGVGVGLGVVALALAGFFFWRRRRRSAKNSVPTSPESAAPGGGDAETPPHHPSQPAHYQPTNQYQPVNQYQPAAAGLPAYASPTAAEKPAESRQVYELPQEARPIEMAA